MNCEKGENSHGKQEEGAEWDEIVEGQRCEEVMVRIAGGPEDYLKSTEFDRIHCDMCGLLAGERGLKLIDIYGVCKECESSIAYQVIRMRDMRKRIEKAARRELQKIREGE